MESSGHQVHPGIGGTGLEAPGRKRLAVTDFSLKAVYPCAGDVSECPTRRPEACGPKRVAMGGNGGSGHTGNPWSVPLPNLEVQCLAVSGSRICSAFVASMRDGVGGVADKGSSLDSFCEECLKLTSVERWLKHRSVQRQHYL